MDIFEILVLFITVIIIIFGYKISEFLKKPKSSKVKNTSGIRVHSSRLDVEKVSSLLIYKYNNKPFTGTSYILYESGEIKGEFYYIDGYQKGGKSFANIEKINNPAPKKKSRRFSKQYYKLDEQISSGPYKEEYSIIRKISSNMINDSNGKKYLKKLIQKNRPVKKVFDPFAIDIKVNITDSDKDNSEFLDLIIGRTPRSNPATYTAINWENYIRGNYFREDFYENSDIELRPNKVRNKHKIYSELSIIIKGFIDEWERDNDIKFVGYKNAIRYEAVLSIVKDALSRNIRF